MATSSKSKQSNAAQEAHAVLTNVAMARSFAPSVQRLTPELSREAASA